MASNTPCGAGSELREAVWRRSLEHQAPRMSWSRVLAALMPRPGAAVVAMVAVCSMLPGLGLAGFALKLAEGDDIATVVGGALGLFGVFGTIPAAFLLMVAALLAGRPGARSVLLAGGALLLVVGGVSCGTAFTLADSSIEGGAAPAVKGMALIYGPFILLFAGLAAAFAVSTPLRLRRDLIAEQRRRVMEVLLDRGSVSISDLMLAANLDEAGVRRHLAELEQASHLAVRVDDNTRRVFTVRRIATRQALLVDLVETRGRLEIEALAGELGEPVPVVRGWIDELLTASALGARVGAGTITFEPGRAGDSLSRSCTACGGPMKAVGRGLYHCAYCDAETYGSVHDTPPQQL